MKWRQALLVLVLVLGATSSLADDALIKPFSGGWRGTEITTSGGDGLALKPQDLDIRIHPDDNGFHINWVGFGRGEDGGLKREKVEATFAPTKRPGVFAFAPGGKSLLSRLFADPATGNPLNGETLLWARLEGKTLTVYSLAINPRGGFDLDRYARTLTENGMTIRYTRRVENDQILTIEGRLTAAGR
jgi:hypothetical protein